MKQLPRNFLVTSSNFIISSRRPPLLMDNHHHIPSEWCRGTNDLANAVSEVMLSSSATPSAVPRAVTRVRKASRVLEDLNTIEHNEARRVRRTKYSTSTSYEAWQSPLGPRPVDAATEPPAIELEPESAVAAEEIDSSAEPAETAEEKEMAAEKEVEEKEVVEEEEEEADKLIGQRRRREEAEVEEEDGVEENEEKKAEEVLEEAGELAQAKSYAQAAGGNARGHAKAPYRLSPGTARQQRRPRTGSGASPWAAESRQRVLPQLRPAVPGGDARRA